MTRKQTKSPMHETAAARAPRRSGRTGKMSSGLVALSSAAVFTVYAAGFAKTKASADRLADASARRPVPGGTADAIPRGAVTPAANAAAGQTSTTEVSAKTSAPMPTAGQHAPIVAQPASAGVQVPTAATPPSGAAQPAAGLTSTSVLPAAEPAHTPELTVANAAAADVTAAAPSASASPATPPALDAAASAALQASVPAKPQSPALKDGTYLGWGTCRHGDIQAEVIVSAGRITSARIAQCWTRWSCSWLDPVVPQVVQRQSPSIDYVSGATQSTDAFYYAVLDALLKAK